MKNYHNEKTQFTIGQAVTHVADNGEMTNGKILQIKGNLLEIRFFDGEQGFETVETCF